LRIIWIFIFTINYKKLIDKNKPEIGYDILIVINTMITPLNSTTTVNGELVTYEVCGGVIEDRTDANACHDDIYFVVWGCCCTLSMHIPTDNDVL